MQALLDFEKDFAAGWAPERDGKTFVNESLENRVQWSTPLSVSKRNTFSTPLLLAREAYRLCSLRIKALLPGQNIGLCFDPNQNSTNSRQILVATKVLDAEKYTASEKLSVMQGAATHEAAHILYTNFSPQYSHNSFQHSILNILEDERIEFLIGERFPGYAKDLAALKQYYFDYLYSLERVPEDAKYLFDTFFKLVRYPKFITAESFDLHRHILEEIKETITPYPLDFVSTYQASVAIDAIFRKYFSFKKVTADVGASSATSSSDVDAITEALGQAMKGLESPNESNTLSPESTSKDLQGDSFTESDQAVITGNSEMDAKTNTYFHKAKNASGNYLSIAKGIRDKARMLAKFLSLALHSRQISRFTNTGASIDGGKLIDAVYGDKFVYKEALQLKSKGMSIALLIDQSGSMHGTKIQLAQQVAVTLTEACKIMRTDFYVYGFTSDQDKDHTNDVYIYHEPGTKQGHGLGEVEARSCNRDGAVIRLLGERIRSKTKAPVLFFVLSDGSPSAEGYGEIGIEDTASAVKELERKNFFMYQIGIGADSNQQKKMFSHFTTLNNLNQLSDDIRKVMVTVAGKFKRSL